MKPTPALARTIMVKPARPHWWTRRPTTSSRARPARARMRGADQWLAHQGMEQGPVTGQNSQNARMARLRKRLGRNWGIGQPFKWIVSGEHFSRVDGL